MTKRLTTLEFIQRAESVHGTKYDYSCTVYVKSTIKLNIRCPIHGTFTQAPHSHLAGIGCPKCGNTATGKKLRGTKQSFIAEAIKIHGFDRIFDCGHIRFIRQ